ncbi:MAG: ABC transporter permease [Anaerofustis sp.]
MKKTKILGYPYVFWMALFILFPMVLMMIYAFTVSDATGMRFSLENIREFFTPIYLNVFLKSLELALISTVLCLALGYPMAFLISRMEPKKRNFFLILVILPTWMNFLLRTYSWMNILGKNGIINKLLELLNLPAADLLYNNGAVLLGMIYNFLPFMIYPIYSILVKIKPSYLEAAMDLGASKGRAFFKVTLPLSVPGIITGITMVFMPAVSTFVIPDLLGGGQSVLIGNVIQTQFLVSGDWNFGSALSVIMMLVILIAMRIMNRFDSTDDKENALW